MSEGQQGREEIFPGALELPDAGRRKEFPDRECAGALRAEAERLMAIHAAAEHFFAETNLQLNDTAPGPSGNRD